MKIFCLLCEKNKGFGYELFIIVGLAMSFLTLEKLFGFAGFFF